MDIFCVQILNLWVQIMKMKKNPNVHTYIHTYVLTEATGQQQFYFSKQQHLRFQYLFEKLLLICPTLIPIPTLICIYEAYFPKHEEHNRCVDGVVPLLDKARIKELFVSDVSLKVRRS